MYKKYAIITIVIAMISISYVIFSSNETVDTVEVKLENPVEIKKIDHATLYSFDEHPCLCLTSGRYPDIDSPPKYYDKTSFYDHPDFNELNLFHTLVESSIMFSYYTEFMRSLEEIVIRKKINDYLNPKYYFILSLKNLYDKNFIAAEQNLNIFLDVKDDYIAGRKSYFDLGCYEKDIEWLLNHNTTKSYEIAQLLLEYSKSKISNNAGSIDLLINEIKVNFDDTPDKYDFVENIIFTLLKAEGFSISKINQYLPLDNDQTIQYSSLNQIFEDGSNYFLPSQLEMISLSKYFQAVDVYDNINWEKLFSNINIKPKPYPNWRLKRKHIYSLMHLYELKIKLFNEFDSKLYAKIENIYNQIKGLDDIEVWINSYNPQNSFIDSPIGKIKSKFTNQISLKDLDILLSKDYLSSNNELYIYITVRDLLIDSHILKSISNEIITFVIPEPILDYKIKIDSFLSLFRENRKTYFKKFPKAFDVRSYIVDDFFSIFDMNNLDGSVEISQRLDENKDIKNEGNDPVSAYWDTVRNYIEARTFIINDHNRCK